MEVVVAAVVAAVAAAVVAVVARHLPFWLSYAR